MSSKSFRARVRDALDILTSNAQPTRVENYRTTLMNLDDHLPQPEEDRKIASKLNLLQGMIEAHATHHFYHQKPIELELEDILDLLQQRLFNSEVATQRLAYNLKSTAYRLTFIRILIGKAVVSAIDLYGDPSTTLLPPEIVLFMTAFKQSLFSRGNDQVDQVALSEWRRIGSYLLSGPQNKVTQLHDTEPRVEAMVDALDAILQPFVENGRVEERGSERRIENLRSIIRTATGIGVLIFGQPCGWELRWTRRPTYEARQLAGMASTTFALQNNIPPVQRRPSPMMVRSMSSTSMAQSDHTTTKRRRRKRLIGRTHSVKEKPDDFRKTSDRYYPPATDMKLPAKSPIQVTQTIFYQPHTGSDAGPLEGPPSVHLNSHYGVYKQQTWDESQFRTNRSRSQPELPRIYMEETRQTRVIPQNVRQQQKLPPGLSEALEERPEASTLTPNSMNGYAEGPPQHDDPTFEEDTATRTRHDRTELFFDVVEDTRDHTAELPRVLPLPDQPGRPVICFPALVKVRDEYGCLLTHPQLVSEPTVDKTVLVAWD